MAFSTGHSSLCRTLREIWGSHQDYGLVWRDTIRFATSNANGKRYKTTRRTSQTIVALILEILLSHRRHSCPLCPVPVCKYFYQMEVQLMLLRHISTSVPALFNAHKMNMLLGGRDSELHVSDTTQWSSRARSARNVVQYIFGVFKPPPPPYSS
jgi:hypothetical protein